MGVCEACAGRGDSVVDEYVDDVSIDGCAGVLPASMLKPSKILDSKSVLNENGPSAPPPAAIKLASHGSEE